MKSINNKELHEIFVKLKENKVEKNFNELYNKYNNLIYKIAFSVLKNREDSEDIVQVVFAKIYKLDINKLPVEYEASWLYSMTKNETLNYMKKRINTVDLDTIYYINSENEELNEIIDIDTYNRLISKLNPKEQEIISLKILANLSFKEISQILKQPSGTVKWRYYKSIHTLKILLSNLGMFLITFIIGLKAILSSKVREEVLEANKASADDENFREEQKENFDQFLPNKPIQDSSESSTNEEIKEEVIIPQDNELNMNYFGIGMLSISCLFLTITIIFTIFFTKYQLKRKKKLSK